MPNFALSALYALDNLEVMRGMDSESVPLIYADPPFNSKRIYQGMSGSKAAPHRFRDTWSWNDAKEEWLDQLENDHPALHRAILVAKDHSPGMGGYCAFMAVRLIEMHRILTPAGSLYLHCDPSANAYLRMLLDLMFGSKNLRNEITWLRRQEKHNLARRRMPVTQDTILWVTKSDQYTYNIQYIEHDATYVASSYKYEDARGRYATFPCTNATGGNKPYEFRGITAPWRFAPERMNELYDQNLLTQATPTSPFRYKKYLSSSPGVKVSDLWLDIPATRGDERTGWNTQKPLALLERIIKASSTEGDIVFDPFCGCGTALVAAENLGRKWVGADDDTNAVDVIRDRIGAMSGKIGALPVAVCVLHNPPQRTEVATAGDVIRDPTGIIIPKMPSDRMSNAAIRDQLLEWQQQPDGTIKCPGCGECLKPRHFHVDHINPKSAGGTNRIDNRILLCGACNIDKGNTRTLPHLWNEQQIRGRQRQEMQRHVTDIQNQARAHVRQMDAGAPAPAPLR